MPPVLERAALPGAGALDDALAIIFCEAGEHLKDEPTARGGGVYGLDGALERYPSLLEPIVGLHRNEQLAPQPVEPIDDHRVELTGGCDIQEPPALGALVHAQRARHAVVGIGVRHL